MGVKMNKDIDTDIDVGVDMDKDHRWASPICLFSLFANG